MQILCNDTADVCSTMERQHWYGRRREGGKEGRVCMQLEVRQLRFLLPPALYTLATPTQDHSHPWSLPPVQAPTLAP